MYIMHCYGFTRTWKYNVVVQSYSMDNTQQLYNMILHSSYQRLTYKLSYILHVDERKLSISISLVSWYHEYLFNWIPGSNNITINILIIATWDQPCKPLVSFTLSVGISFVNTLWAVSILHRQHCVVKREEHFVCNVWMFIFGSSNIVTITNVNRQNQ